LAVEGTLTSYSDELVRNAGSVPKALDSDGNGSPAPTSSEGLLDERKDAASPDAPLSDASVPLSALAKMSKTLALEALLLWGSRVAR
jgi:hypothetical protein